MAKIIHFGERVPGYDIPVLNEREIRAAAGILFLFALIALMIILFKGDFGLIRYFITFFLVDFVVRVFVSPAYSPTLILGRLIVRNQVPEYVGAQQKKFAWKIGIGLGVLMYVFLIIVNAYSPITGLSCLICLVFLFFESAFGICLGCKFYSLFNKGKAQYCPGEVCDRKARQDIQKTSGVQLLILGIFIVSIVFSTFLCKNYYSRAPHDLFGSNSIAKNK
jgi:hypothetical protein